MNDDFEQPLPPETLDQDQRLDFFLCHPSSIKPTVRRLATKIRAAGMSYWLDEQHKTANQSGIRAISQGLDRSDILVALIDRQALERGWVEAELESRIHQRDSYLLVLVDLRLEDWQTIRPTILSKHPLELRHGDRYFIEHLEMVRRTGRVEPPGAEDQAAILKQFEIWSRHGQGRDYTIQGRRLKLPVVDQIVSELKPGISLLEGGPGAGKSGILRETFGQCGTAKLFLKMDLFLEESPKPNLQELARQAEQLARTQPVAIFLDSLDVLSLHRQSEAFRATLGLLDHLEGVENLRVLVACRSFDRTFDPSLKARKWTRVFALAGLDYVTEVEPFLIELSCQLPESTRLQELLKIPQNLGLYVDLCLRFPNAIVRTACDLYEEYLAKLVDLDPCLRQEGRLILQRLAVHLFQERCQMAPQTAWAQPRIVQALVSLNILHQPRPGWVGFSHQTWLEFLGVRAALERGQTLAEFILSQDQLPFCRPFVRAYFQQMSHLQANFLSQIREAIESPAITFHLKRLLVIELGRQEVDRSSLPLLHSLSRNQPELIPFLLQNLATLSWLALLREHWLEQVWIDPNRQNQVYWFLGRLDFFVESQPALVLSLTLRGLSGDSSYRGGLQFLSVSLLKHTSIARLPESRELMEWHLLHSSGDIILGDCLATWLGFRDAQEEELLWSYLKLPDPGAGGHGLLEDHSLALPDGFLSSRFVSSPQLAGRFLQWLEAQSTSRTDPVEQILLDEELLSSSSWAMQRHDAEMYPHSSLVTLLTALEAALAEHARQDSELWRSAERTCALSELGVLTYLRLRSISQALPTQLALAEPILHKGELLHGRFSYEWCELCKSAYPFLAPEQRQAHQAWLNKQESRVHVAHAAEAIYGCYRSPEVQLMLDEWVKLNGPPQRKPPVRSAEGWVCAPFDVDQLHGLSDAGVVHLFLYLGHRGYGPADWQDFRVGGKPQILQVLGSAASTDPNRLFRLLPEFEGMGEEVLWSVLSGLASSIGYHSGRVQSSQPWTALSHLDAEAFCKNLLTRPGAFREQPGFLDLLRDCSYSPLSRVVARAVIQALPSSAGLGLPRSEGGDLDSLTHAINSALGKAVDTALAIVVEQASGDQAVEPLAIEYLEAAARRNSPAIHVLILRSLPNLIWHKPQVGWPLFDLCSSSARVTQHWNSLEQCLYVNYRKHTQRVCTTLDNLWEANAAVPRCGEMWGRIRALMVLGGMFASEDLVRRSQSPGVWSGAAHVFGTNLALGAPFLTELLACPPTDPSQWANLDRCLFEKSNFSFLSAELAMAYLGSRPVNSATRLTLLGVSQWLEHFSAVEPAATVQVLTSMAEVMDKPEFYGDTLIRVFVNLLREVDFRNDSNFTRQVIALQDRYVQLAPTMMDRLYEAALA